ncbi:hypothetical protein HMPREF0058_0642, partial [Actinomyces urogenitalis DSM 15434]
RRSRACAMRRSASCSLGRRTSPSSPSGSDTQAGTRVPAT